jgi:hypothetical protein
MAIKKGRATDAVARLFSVTAAEQAHEAYEAHEVKREHPVPETYEAQEAYEAPHMSDTQEAYEAHEAHEVKREHPVPETHEAQEAYEAPHMPGTHEAHEAYETNAPKADGAYRAADTQGKRGKKALRMTMAFSEENMDYIRTMGKLESGGATAYVNRLIEADRRKHADVYRQMKTLRPDA